MFSDAGCWALFKCIKLFVEVEKISAGIFGAEFLQGGPNGQRFLQAANSGNEEDLELSQATL